MLAVCMKYVFAAQRRSDLFVDRGTLRSPCAGIHQRADGDQAAELVFHDRSQLPHCQFHVLLLNFPAPLPLCVHILAVEIYLHEKHSKGREVSKTVNWAKNIKQIFSSLREVIDF